MTLLETIREPSQLRDLTDDQLEVLAAELREKMIRTVHKTGGHLASSLGVVELTLALHRVMDSPRDRIVWDTGHQAYAHKLLTGRSDRFDTLRQVGGIGGFPRRSESEHDVFDGGHAGTGVSLGVGLAAARDVRPDTDPARRQRIAVCVGDAAMGSGLTLEALNHLGHVKHPLLIVLNDNEMSISPSVGGLSTRLNRLRLSRAYQETKSVTQRALPRIPLIGRPAFEALAWAKEGFKRTWAKVGFFEDIGLTYIGVLDGHDLPELERAFEAAFQLEAPVVVHVKTIKGRGYAPAEEDAMSFHGASLPPIDLCVIDPTEEPLPAEEAPKKKAKTYTQTFVEELVRLAETDERITAITAGMPTGTGLQRFADHYPARFHDVGIAEPHAVTMAAGLALGGMRPVVALYSTFSQRAFDGLVHDVCQNDLPVLLGLDRSGLVGEDGTSHQGMFMLPAMRSVPRLAIGSPKDEQELRDLVVTALAHPGPMALLYPRDAGEDLPDRLGEALPIGRGEVLREGSDLLLVGFGPIVQRLLLVADALSADGLAATVINARWAKPLDEALIAEHAAGKRLVVTAEESAPLGGFGDGVLDALNRVGIHVPLHRIALNEGFVDHGAVDDLRRLQRIDAPGILEQVREAVGTYHRRMARIRLDQLLVERGLAPSPVEAQALIHAGEVELDGNRRLKPGQLVATDALVATLAKPRWASRAGAKLEAALDAWEIDVTGLAALDAGASTGGFTDVLLDRGARIVYAVDVGRAQLIDRLRRDPRVVSMERTNLRELRSLPEPIQLATLDLSFISLTLVLPAVRELLDPAGRVVALVKPQFEAGREDVPRGGVVRDPETWRQVLATVTADATRIGLYPTRLMRSPIAGGDGNVEFLIELRADGAAVDIGADLEAAVAGTHTA